MQTQYAQVAGGSINQAVMPNRRRTDFPRDRRSADMVLIAWPANRPDRRAYRSVPPANRFALGVMPAHEARWDRRAEPVTTPGLAEDATAACAGPFVTIQACALILFRSVAELGQFLYDDVQCDAAPDEAAEGRRTIATWKDDSNGVTSLEYGLLAALVTIVVIAGFSLLDSKISTTLSTLSNALPSG